MEKLKFTMPGRMLMLLGLFSLVMLASCGDDDPVKPADVTALNAKIVEAENLIATTEEGIAEGQYSYGSQAVLQTAIDNAKLVAADETATQTDVDNTVVALQAAMDEYLGKVIIGIDPDNLVAQWLFDEGEGSTVTDVSGNAFEGTFMTGHADQGTGVPAWTTDRYGNANGAIEFTNGAWIEVPYNAALNPTEITISVWVKANVVKAGNKILGLNKWEGYKFQLQDTPKAFFTAATEEGPIYDADTDPVLEIDAWYHLAVSFGGGNMTFYVDGEKQAQYTDKTGTLRTVPGEINFSIGRELADAADVSDNFFDGAIDEIRIYKTVLSDNQVKSIYDVEKPQ